MRGLKKENSRKQNPSRGDFDEVICELRERMTLVAMFRAKLPFSFPEHLFTVKTAIQPERTFNQPPASTPLVLD